LIALSRRLRRRINRGAEAKIYSIDVSGVTTNNELGSAVAKGLGRDTMNWLEFLEFLENLPGPTIITVSGLSGITLRQAGHLRMAIQEASEFVEGLSVRFI
jgi:hypothetical protein